MAPPGRRTPPPKWMAEPESIPPFLPAQSQGLFNLLRDHRRIPPPTEHGLPVNPNAFCRLAQSVSAGKEAR